MIPSHLGRTFTEAGFCFFLPCYLSLPPNTPNSCPLPSHPQSLPQFLEHLPSRSQRFSLAGRYHTAATTFLVVPHCSLPLISPFPRQCVLLSPPGPFLPSTSAVPGTDNQAQLVSLASVLCHTVPHIASNVGHFASASKCRDWYIKQDKASLKMYLGNFKY